jgi:hypothetical protein
MRHTVLVHDLRASELEVGRVDLATENLVERSRSGEDDGLSLDLDRTLSETNEVRSDTDGAGGDEGDGEDVVVGARRLSRDESRSLERLDSEAVLETDDVGDLVADLASLHDLLRDHAALALALELAQPLRREVEVLESLLRTALVDPGGAERVDELLGDTETSTRVGGEVHSRESDLARELGDGEEVAVLLGSERSNLERDVVGDDDDPPASGVLGRPHRVDPSDHSDVVRSRRARDLLGGAELVEDELSRDEGVGGRRLACCLPLATDRLAEEVGEVVRVRGADDVGLVSLGLKPLLGGVRRADGLEVEGALGTDRLEDGDALLRDDLAVRLVLDDESRDVLDDGSDRLDVPLRVLNNDADLGARDSQTPESLAVAVDESSEGLLDLLELEAERVKEV